MLNSIQLWRDRRGRVSPLRILALALLVMPVLLAITAAFSEQGFGARPINDLIHRAGYWALVFLILALAIGPLRRIGRYGTLIDVRRMIGVGAFVYAAAHILLYTADQMFDLGKVVSEIVLRLYLTIGFFALLGLTVLAATSTDGMVRRLGGRRWQRLHQAVYVIALLALVHFFQQTKADIWVPTFVASVFGWLMCYRFITWWWQIEGELSPVSLLALTGVVSALTFIGEAIGIGIAYNVSPFMVLQSALDFDIDMIRPGWLALGAGLCVVALDVTRAWWRKPRRPGGKPMPAPVPARPRQKVV